MRFALFISLTAAVWAQESSELTRDGPYYVRTMSAPVAVQIAGKIPPQLHVISRGNVLLRGAKGNEIVYKFVQRAKARSYDEAKRLFRPVLISALPMISMTTLTVIPSAGDL